MAWKGTVVTSDVEGNYITSTDLTNYGVNMTDITDAQKAMHIADVESEIERLTGDQFYLSSGVTKYFDGSGKDMMFFRPVTNLRLRNLTSACVWNRVTASVTTALVEITDFIVSESDESLQRVDGGIWPKSVQNIRVIGDWGWIACPEPIRWCAALMIALKVDPNFKGLHVDSHLSWPHLSITRVTTGKRIAPITGVPNIDRILWKYRRSSGFMAAP